MKLAKLIIACITVATLSGCLAAVAGAGTAGIREMTDKAITYNGDVEAVYNAVHKTLTKDMGGTVKETVREEGKAGKRTIRGKTFDNEVITIDMEPVTPSTVLVEVRIGRIGSKTRAEEFHKSLQKYLKTK